MNCIHKVICTNGIIFCEKCGTRFVGNLCINCGLHPQNPPHLYCRKACAMNHFISNQNQQNNQQYPPQIHQNNYQQIPNQNNKPLCLNCNQNQRNSIHDYCSKTCARNHNFKARKMNFGIELMNLKDPKYVNVENQFISKFKGVNAKINKIYRVFVPLKIEQDYESYKKNIISIRPKLVQYNKGGSGNEQRRFHGTKLGCNFANDKICTNSTCSYCRIIETGFQMKYSVVGDFGIGFLFQIFFFLINFLFNEIERYLFYFFSQQVPSSQQTKC